MTLKWQVGTWKNAFEYGKENQFCSLTGLDFMKMTKLQIVTTQLNFMKLYKS